MGNINLKLYSISNLITVNIAQKIKGVSNNEKQKNTKRFCTVLLVLCVLLSMTTVISARYTAIRSLTADLTISSGGYASCLGDCTVRSEYDAEVILELQQKKGSSWTTIMDWSDSGRRVSFDKGQFVSRGYDYRLKISADIYDSDGDLVEDATSYSTIESF